MSTRERDEPGERSSHPEPEQVVQAFIRAMNAWEREAARISEPFSSGGGVSATSHTAAQTRIDASLDEVFRSCCTERARTRPYRRHASYQIPPEYDPRLEKVVRRDIDGHRALVETLRDAPLGGGRQYVLHRHGEAWRIDSVKRRGRGDAWLADTL